MFNKALLMAFAKKVEVDDPRYTLSFVASNDGSGISLFNDVSDTYHPDSAFTVIINGKVSDQSYKSLSFVKGDTVKITCDKDFSFPTFSSRNKIIVSEILPLPFMTSSSGGDITVFSYTFSYCNTLSYIPEGLFDNNTKVTDFTRVFSSCSGLTSIPENLFANHTNATKFDSVFSSCSGLKSIPEGLFDNNTKVTSFYGVFSSCSGLTSIPENLFANNAEVTNFSLVFTACSNLKGRVKIGSSNVTQCRNFCDDTGAITVIVPAGSTTETTFRAYAETVSNLTVETF